jgi:GABA permease
MISLGGLISACLCVGSSAIISEAGPGAFFISGLTGLLVALVMRMLGQMASARPTTGSFTDYSRMGRPREAESVPRRDRRTAEDDDEEAP